MFDYEADEHTLTIFLSGEIDHHRAAAVRHSADELIDRFSPKQVILDFSRITFCDSSGIAIVLGRYKKMKELGGEVILCNLPKQADTIFRLANIQKLVKIKERDGINGTK